MNKLNEDFKRAIPMAVNSPAFPLSLAGRSDTVRIARYRSGTQMESRVKDLGLAPGVTVKILRNDGHGPLLLLVGGSRLALGGGMARKIMVTLEEGNKE